MNWVDKLLSLFGAKSSQPPRRAEPAFQIKPSLIDRHPLSYGSSPDPLSDEAKIEIERQRTMRKPMGTGGMGHL